MNESCQGFLVTLILSTAGLTAAAGPVDDLRAADCMGIDTFTGVMTPAVEYWFLGSRWYALPGENMAGIPRVVPKSPGTLDIDLASLLPDFNLPPLVTTGTERPGDMVVWDLDRDLDQNVLLELGGTAVTVSLTHAEAEVTAKVESVADFYSQRCQRVFNCTLVDTGGEGANHITIHIFMDEGTRAILVEQVGIPPLAANVLTGVARLTLLQLDYAGSSGVGTVPQPWVVSAARNDEMLELVFDGLLRDAPYAVQASSSLSSSDWRDIATTTAPGPSHGVAVPLPAGVGSSYRLAFPPSP